MVKKKNEGDKMNKIEKELNWFLFILVSSVIAQLIAMIKCSVFWSLMAGVYYLASFAQGLHVTKAFEEYEPAEAEFRIKNIVYGAAIALLIFIPVLFFTLGGR